MAWIEAHQTLKEHRKVLAVAERLDVEEAQVTGHLVLLWMWGLDNAPLGVLPASKRTIEKAAAWHGKPGELLEALEEAGLVDRREDGVLMIHDWHEYGQKLQEQRLRNREKQARYRSRVGNADRHVTVTNTEGDGNDEVTMTVTLPDDGRDGDRNVTGDITVTMGSALPENNGLENTTQHNTRENYSPPSGAPLGASAAPDISESRAKRGRQIAEEFVPSAAMAEWAKNEFGFDRARIEAETARFRDHFTANGKPMKDWIAAWRNWIRRSAEFQPPGMEPALPASAAAIREEEQRREREQRQADHQANGSGFREGWASRGAPVNPRLGPKLVAAIEEKRSAAATAPDGPATTGAKP